MKEQMSCVAFLEISNPLYYEAQAPNYLLLASSSPVLVYMASEEGTQLA